MKDAVLLWVLLGVAPPVAVSQDGAKAAAPEYDKRSRELYRKIQDRRLKLAEDIANAGLHAWARLEHEKVLAHDPDCEKSRLALGFKREESEWVKGGEGLPVVNKVSKEDLPKRTADYLKELDAIGRDAAKLHVDLAAWCEKNGLADLARSHRIEALAYDPMNKAAADALGFKTSKLLPFPSDPETVEMFRAFREDASKVNLGDVKTADNAWASDALKKRLKVVYGEHVGIETQWMSEEWMKDLAREGDHAFNMAHKLFDFEAPKDEKRYWFAYLDYYGFEDQSQWLYKTTPNPKTEDWRDDSGACDVSRSRDEKLPLHDPAHCIPQFVVTRRLWTSRPPDEKASILEGFAVLCEFLAVQTNDVYCVGAPSTGTQGNRHVYRSYAAAAASEVSDLSVATMFKTGFNSLHNGNGACKAASVFEMLFARDRKEAVSFFKEMAESKDSAQTIRKHYGWSPEEFDEHWRRWAIAINKADEESEKSNGGRKP